MQSCARRNKYAQNPHITLILKLSRCFKSHIVWFVKDIKLLLIFFAFHSASCCNLMVFLSFNCKYYYDNLNFILRYIWSMPIFSCNDNIYSNINPHFSDIDPNMNMPNVFRLQSLYICIRDSLYKSNNHCHHLNKVKKISFQFSFENVKLCKEAVMLFQINRSSWWVIRY